MFESTSTGGLRSTPPKAARWLWGAIAGVTLYSAARLGPYVLPTFSTGPAADVRAASLILALVALLGLVAVGFWEAKVHRSLRAATPLFKTVLVGSMGLVVVEYGTYHLYLGLPLGSNLRGFDAAVWTSSFGTVPWPTRLSPRQEMLADVVKRVIVGETRATVEQALGSPVRIVQFSDAHYDMAYLLGPARGAARLDSEWLLLWVGGNGRVERYDVVED